MFAMHALSSLMQLLAQQPLMNQEASHLWLWQPAQLLKVGVVRSYRVVETQKPTPSLLVSAVAGTARGRVCESSERA